MRRLLPFILLLTGCITSLEAPTDAQITCERDAHCPGDRTCRAGQCVPRSLVSADAAQLVDGALSPEHVGPGVTLRAELRVAGELRGAPAVVLSVPARTPMALVQASEGVYAYELTVTADLPEVRVDALASFVDVAGNIATDVVVGAGAVLDFTPPRVTSISDDGATPVRAGDARHLDFAVSEPLSEVSAETAGGAALERDPSIEAPSYRMRWTPGAGDADGAHVVSIELRDLAGNVTVHTPAATFVVDNEAPDLAGAPTLLRDTVRAGQVMQVDFAVTEGLAQLPQVDAVRAGTRTPLAVRATGASTYAASLEIDGAFPSGGYELEVPSMRDAAGNVAAPKPLGSVVVDLSPPQFVVLPEADRTLLSREDGFDGTTITFTLDEPLTADRVEVRVGRALSAPCLTEDTELGRAYSCEYTVQASDVEGPHFVAVNVVDVAGNDTTDSVPEPLVFDFTPPSLVGTARLIRSDFYTPAQVSQDHVFLSGTSVGVNGAPTLSVMFALSEPLADDVDPVFSLPGTWTRQAGSGGGFFVFAYEQPASPPQGQTPILLTVADPAGNVAADLAIGTVTFDYAPPSLATVLDKLTFVRAPWGSHDDAPSTARLELAFAPTDTLEPFGRFMVLGGANPANAAVLASVDMDALGYPHDGAGNPQPLPLSGANVNEVFVSLRDRAGNLDASSATRVRRGQWIASLRVEDGLAQPHQALAVTHVRTTPRQTGSTIMSAGLNRVDGAVHSVSTDGLDLFATYRRCGFASCGTPPPATLPSNRDAYAGGYDRVSHSVVFFGGLQMSPLALRADTWMWDGDRWLQGAGGPPGRYGAVLVEFDHRDPNEPSNLIMFGGGTVSGGNDRFLCDTWRFTGTSWIQRDSDGCAPGQEGSTKPKGRYAHAAAYDPKHNRVLMMGGACYGSPSPTPCSDMWHYEWQDVGRAGWEPAHFDEQDLAGRSLANLTYDRGRDVMVLFSGRRYGGGIDDGVWEATWNPDAQPIAGELGQWEWTKKCSGYVSTDPECQGTCTCTQSPVGRVAGSFTYMQELGGAVLIGGVDQDYGDDPLNYVNRSMQQSIWLWNGDDWEMLADYYGCTFDGSTCDLVTGNFPYPPYPLPARPLVYADEFAAAYQLDEEGSSNYMPVLGGITSRRAERAAVQAGFRFSEANVPSATVQRLRLRFVAGGTTYGADGSWTDGAELWIRDPRLDPTAQRPYGWVQRATTTAGTSAPTGDVTFDSSTQAVPAEALLDEARALSAMIVSPSGKDQSGVAVDYLEARIDYTLP